MKKSLLRMLSLLCLLGSAIGLGSCGSSEPATQTTTATKDVIKSLTANNDEIILRLTEDINSTKCYELKGNGSLNSSQKAVTIVSSNDSVVKVQGKKLVALSVGEATITITSDIDNTKSCYFKVIVKNAFFSRTYSNFPGTDDTSKELVSEGAVVEAAPGGKNWSQANYVIDGIDSITWMTEVTVTVKNVLDSEHFPKFGIMTTSTDKAAEGGSNQIHFFLDGFISDETPNYKWTNFGVCEVYDGGQWAWNTGVGNNIARHKDDAYSLPEGQYVTGESYKTANPDDLAAGVTSFKMKVARKGYQFHIWVNDNYAFSMEVLHYLLTGSDGQPCASMPGFFQFNSNVVFSNYSATSVEADVSAAIDGIEGGAKVLTNADYADD